MPRYRFNRVQLYDRICEERSSSKAFHDLFRVGCSSALSTEASLPFDRDPRADGRIPHFMRRLEDWLPTSAARFWQLVVRLRASSFRCCEILHLRGSARACLHCHSIFIVWSAFVKWVCYGSCRLPLGSHDPSNLDETVRLSLRSRDCST